MNIAKNKIKRLAAILLILVAMLLPVCAFAATSTTETITVKTRLSGKVTSYTEAFTFILTPDDPSYPMPAGENGNRLTIIGEGTDSFGAITYWEPDTYTYTLQEVSGSADDLSYDNTTYKVTVFVATDDAGNLTSNLWIAKLGTDGKSEEIDFENEYTEKPPIKPLDPSDPRNPSTGDETNITLYIGLFGSFAAALLILWVGSKRKKKDYRQF